MGYSRIPIVAGILLLTGCTTIQDDIKKSSDVAKNVTTICSRDDVKSLSSPTAILNGFKTNIEADFGLSTDPADAPDKTNIQQTLDDLKSQFAKLKADDQATVANVKTAIATLKVDVGNIRADVEGQFSVWKKDELAECKNSPLSCYINTATSLDDLAQTVQDDAATLETDANNFVGTVEGDLQALAGKGGDQQKVAQQMEVDFHKLETMAGVLKEIVDDIIGLGHQDSDPQHPVASDLKQALKESFIDYLAYESAYQTENVMAQLSRDAVAKIDAASAQTWGIAAFSGTIVGLGIYAGARDGIKDFAVNARDTQRKGAKAHFKASFYQALVGQSCARLGQDTTRLDSNAARAELLQVPIQIMLICDDNKIDESGNIASCVADPDQATAQAGAPPAVQPAAQAQSTPPLAVALANAKANSSGTYLQKARQSFSTIYRTAECQQNNAAGNSCNPEAKRFQLQRSQAAPALSTPAPAAVEANANARKPMLASAPNKGKSAPQAPAVAPFAPVSAANLKSALASFSIPPSAYPDGKPE